MFDFTSIWQSLLSFIEVHLPYISPFWTWLAEGAVVMAICAVIGWAFPPLRSFCGAAILVIISFLVGVRKGENAQYRHDRDK